MLGRTWAPFAPSLVVVALVALQGAAVTVPFGEFVWLNTSASTLLPYDMRLAELNVTALPSDDGEVTAAFSVTKRWVFGSDSLREDHSVRLDGWPSSNHITSRIFYANVFTGLEYNTSANATVRLEGGGPGTRYVVQRPLLTSQGSVLSHEVHSMEAFDDGCLVVRLQSTVPVQQMTFWMRERASTAASCANYSVAGLAGSVVLSRPSDAERSIATKAAQRQLPQQHRLRENHASPQAPAVTYNFNVTDSWFQSEQEFQINAMMIGLQGLANGRSAKPALYLTYPPSWAYSYTASVLDYMLDTYRLSCEQLAPIDPTAPKAQFEASLAPLRPGHPVREAARVQGVVVWDTTVRASLLVSMTVAGLHDALVVSDELYARFPPELQASLPVIRNFSTMFRGKSDASIYQWAFDEYFDLCNHTYLLWLGGECAAGEVRPAVADFGTAQRAFFVDLNTTPNASDPEYALANKIVAATAQRSGGDFLLQGWHSYCKDQEHTFTTLASQHGGRVHGLNTNPNLSWMNTFKLPEDFVFRNNHAPATVCNSSKVYIVFVQTDGIGLGAWTLPGRGSIPYAWEVTLPDLWIQPALLRMFYEQASANDTFVAALSGPGYMYPKAQPAAQLGTLLGKAQEYLTQLDLHHMVVFDASATVGEHTATGDCNLPESVVDAYFEHMPDTAGFLNGYAPAFSAKFRGHSAVRNASSLISFDYYLDPGSTVEQTVRDLHNLALVNVQRPYFLPVHVREWSDVDKVTDVVDSLGEDFEVVPVDTFFRHANAHPTFRERFK